VKSILRKLYDTLILTFLLGTISNGQVSAQSVQVPSTTLAPVIVTGSTEVTNPFLDTPAAVQYLDAHTIYDTDVKTSGDILNQIPNARAAQTSLNPGTTYTVRGSTEDANMWDNSYRSSVATYIDDIPSIDTQSRNNPLFNVASAEFYSGPQETFFGAPSPAGALNIYSAAPTNNWTGGVDYQYGSDQFQQVQANLNVPIIKNQLYAGFAGTFSEQDGFLENLFNNQRINGYQKENGLFRLVYQPVKELEIGLTLGLGRVYQSSFIGLQAFEQQPNPYQLFTPFNGYNHEQNNLEALRIVWHGDGYRILNVTSRQAQTVNQLSNGTIFFGAPGGTAFFPNPVPPPPVIPVPIIPYDWLLYGFNQHIVTYTEELRVESDDPKADLQWRGGFFFSDRTQTGNNGKVDFDIAPFGPFGTGTFVIPNDVNEQDYALYGQATYKAWEKWDFTGGLRLEWVNQDRYSGAVYSNAAVKGIGEELFDVSPGTASSSYSGGDFLPSAQVAYHWTDSQLSWFKASKAWKPGGAGEAQIGPNYDKETSWNFELGHKASFWDDQLTVSPVLFYSRYHNYQTYIVNSPLAIFDANAERATAYGAELSISTHPLPGLELNTNWGYTEARYNKFSVPASEGNPNGTPIENIPEFTIDNNVTYRYALTKETGLLARVDYNVTGDYHITDTSYAHPIKQGAYGLLAARVGYEFRYGGVYLFGTNLTNTHYGESLRNYSDNPPLGLTGIEGAPRVLGVEANVKF
jgi:iron complex outermembrane recepter protein